MRIAQIAFVVADLEAALERYSRLLGAQSWRCFTFSSAQHATAEYRGSPADFTVRLALSDGSPQLELIEPVEGSGIHREWLDDGSSGVQHIGVVVDSVVAATGQLASAGCPVMQSGSGFGADGDGAYAYYDARDLLGVIVEAFEPPARLPGPDFIWSA
jgi:methylmalonyl-CoA/ethylmalonyl-CoA epimerase